MSGSLRRPLVVGNWKMNLTEVQAATLVDQLLQGLSTSPRVDVAVAPAFPCLRVVADRISGTSLLLGAQNLHWEDSGPFTGEVSGRMLAELGVRVVIVGHSERRTHFGETDERVQRKMAAARRHEMIPILCVGEQESERDDGRTMEVVARQLRRGLSDVALRQGSEVVIAYEPVWAIGTGRAALPGQIQEVHRMIREELGSMVGSEIASKVRILYGGSVAAGNAADLLGPSEVDGALVGGASLQVEQFRAIVGAAA